MSLLCPSCGLKLQCKDTRRAILTNHVRRRYYCACGERYSTIEEIVATDKQVPRSELEAAGVKQAIKVLEQWLKDSNAVEGTYSNERVEVSVTDTKDTGGNKV